MRIAVYPGSFDPITNGHLNIIKRAAKLYDRLVVGVLDNSAKNALFSEKEILKSPSGVMLPLSSNSSICAGKLP